MDLKQKPETLTLVPSPSSREENKPISLYEMIRQDSELMDFFKLVREHDFRQRAHDMLEKRMNDKR